MPNSLPLEITSPPSASDSVDAYGTAVSNPPFGSAVLTEDELVQLCLKMKPKFAARLRDSSLCVTPLVEWLIVEGRLTKLELIDGKHAALNVRVSSAYQRTTPDQPDPIGCGAVTETSTEVATNGRRKSRKDRKDQGYSEEEQIRRGIRFFVAKGWAFRIYSDAGVTGEYPHNDPALIAKLLEKKAQRYAKIFNQVLLDDTSRKRRTPQQVAAMEAYRDKRVAQIRALVAPPSDERSLFDGRVQTDEQTEPSPPRKRPKIGKAYFRQGFSQIWEDVCAEKLHTLAASDRSRLARDADLETALLDLLFKHHVRLVGTIEDMSSIDVSDPVKRGVNYLVASLNEARLTETALAAFRGRVQRVESGRSLSSLPWWVRAGDNGKAEFVPGCEAFVRRAISLFLQGYGVKAIVTRFREEEIMVGGKYLTESQIRNALSSDALTGDKEYYGLTWRVLPVVIDDPDLMAELQAKRAERRDEYGFIIENARWGEHLFVSLLRCKCGMPMIHRAPTKNAGANCDGGYYVCTALRKVEGGSRHASVTENQLGRFVGALVAENPNVISGVLARALGGPSPLERAARRALLEEQLTVAIFDLEEGRAAEVTRAEASAVAFGLEAGSTAFADAVETLARGALTSRSQAVEQIKTEIGLLQIDASKGKRNETTTQALKQLGGWDNLDTSTKNRLLRSVFEQITVFPRSEENCLEIKLIGIDQPLPRIYLLRTARQTVGFPSVAQWVSQMFPSPDASCGNSKSTEPHCPPLLPPLMNTRTMESFYRYLTRDKADDETAHTLAVELRATRDPSVRKTATWQYTDRALRRNNASEEVMGIFDVLWTEYIKRESERLSLKERTARMGMSELTFTPR